MPLTDLNENIKSTFDELDESIKSYTFSFAPREVGYVTSVSTGIVKVSGLPGAGFEELLKFSADLFGIAYKFCF